MKILISPNSWTVIVRVPNVWVNIITQYIFLLSGREDNPDLFILRFIHAQCDMPHWLRLSICLNVRWIIILACFHSLCKTNFIRAIRLNAKYMVCCNGFSGFFNDSLLLLLLIVTVLQNLVVVKYRLQYPSHTYLIPSVKKLLRFR